MPFNVSSLLPPSLFDLFPGGGSEGKLTYTHPQFRLIKITCHRQACRILTATHRWWTRTHGMFKVEQALLFFVQPPYTPLSPLVSSCTSHVFYLFVSVSSYVRFFICYMHMIYLITSSWLANFPGMTTFSRSLPFLPPSPHLPPAFPASCSSVNGSSPPYVINMAPSLVLPPPAPQRLSRCRGGRKEGREG